VQLAILFSQKEGRCVCDEATSNSCGICEGLYESYANNNNNGYTLLNVICLGYVSEGSPFPGDRETVCEVDVKLRMCPSSLHRHQAEHPAPPLLQTYGAHLRLLLVVHHDRP